jgi:hydroxymethylpyrimidine pyrophosphatase-like HAD family hydrolase
VRLVASDLDGTLLLPDKTLSARTIRVLRDLVQAGVVLVLVTARPPSTVRPLARQLQAKGLAICANGALIYDLDSDAIVKHSPCAPDVIASLVIGLREAAPGVRFALELGGQYACEPGYLEWNPAVWRDSPMIDDVLVLCTSPVTKLTARHPEIGIDALLDLTRALGGDTIGVTHSGGGVVEVSAAGVHKAWALAWLAGSLGLDQQDVVAFGDMPNDLAMLQWAGRGVAVANAHPDLLAAADEVTLSHTEDGVAVTLERLLRERKTPLHGRVG